MFVLHYFYCVYCFVCKQKTAYEMRISDWSSDVCSSDLEAPFHAELLLNQPITAPDRDKDVRHFEISLEGSQLTYQPGDALGVWPVQAEALVTEVLQVDRKSVV